MGFTCLFLRVFVYSFHGLSNYPIDWSLLLPIDSSPDHASAMVLGNVDIADVDLSAISIKPSRLKQSPGNKKKFNSYSNTRIAT